MAPLAALFPGQNSQEIGMGKRFYDSSPAAKTVLDEAEAALPGLLEIMWQGPEETLKRTANQQPALVAAGAAAFAAYLEAGGEMPAYAAGHSLGEITAHVAAGSLTITEAVGLVHRRGRYMQEAVPEGEGAMAAVMKLDAPRIVAVLGEIEGIVELANLNSPGQTVISGEREAVLVASARLKEAGARVVPLNVSAPFHCSLMKPAAQRLARDLAGLNFREPRMKIVSNVTADFFGTQDAPGLLEQQVVKPVRWTECMERLHQAGVTRFLEFGSGKVLTGLASRILVGVQAQAVTDIETLEVAL